MQVDISSVIGEYGYSQIKYNANPLNEKSALGLPGKEFSILGPYARSFSSSSENSFINNLFPSSQNYSYRVEYKPGGVEDISVFDSKNNRVAWYIHVPGSKDLLSTYKYDENDRLVRILPFLYHEKVYTLYKLSSQLQFISKRERELQESLGIHVSYDEKGNMIAKTTPDSGKVEYLYDNNELLKFALHYSNLNNTEVENIICFNYDQLARLSSTGKLTSLLPKEELLTLTLNDSNTQEYQRFDYGDFEREPILRGKLKRTVTFNGGEPFIEESILDMDKKTISKRVIVPIEDNDPLMVAINKKYVAGKLKEIDYRPTAKRYGTN